MNMIHRFMGCIREYKKPTILTLLCMVGEVAIEVLIPFFMILYPENTQKEKNPQKCR